MSASPPPTAAVISTSVATPKSSATTAPQASESPKEELKRWHGFLAGVASGVTKLAVGHPFDTIKVRMQVRDDLERNLRLIIFASIITSMAQTLPDLDKGFNVRNRTVQWTLALSHGNFEEGRTEGAVQRLGSLSNYKLLLQGGDPTVKLTPWQTGLAGIGAGITVSFVAAPVEHIKARLQVQYDAKTKLYSGPIDCAKQLIRNNGIRGLWKGLVPTMWFRSWFFMWWSSYEIYGGLMRKYTNMSEPAINFWAGGLGANTFWLFSFPHDVIKNRIMTQPDVKNPPFPNIRSVAKHIYRTEGLKGFYRGFVPCLLRAFPTNACALTSFELTMRWLRAIDE
ncbi:hypothetical protein BGW42_007376 [Actinomortierella wolfii]|nr:hypothetical protein BGW42_007376 [Actinomortierella wolfii]